MKEKGFAEFFAGIGLMRVGLEQAGWNIKFANDIDPIKAMLYKNNFGEEDNFILGDIHKISADAIPDIQLATASFPCTDLSLAGRRNGLGGVQSSAFWGFTSILEKLEDRRPVIILLENVTGFLSSHKGEDFKKALYALNDLGYLVDAFIINASNFVPQSRERLFIVGHLPIQQQSSLLKEQPAFFQSSLRPKRLANFIFDNSGINWDLRELPTLPQLNKKLNQIIEKISNNSLEWWSNERVDYLIGQMSDKHKKIIVENLNSSKYNYGTVFRRIRNGKSMAELRFDGIAGCLRTPKGGSAKQILVKFGRGKVFARLLNPRECAKLMGSDDFKITGTSDQMFFGFGDAVCVPVVRWIADNYLNPLYDELTNDYQLSKDERLLAAI